MRIEVTDPIQITPILETIAARLSDWRGVWLRLERKLPDIQKEWWDARFDRALYHKAETVRARRKRLGYYEEPPGERARPAEPYFEWTGSLREATEKFTKREPLSAAIDAEKNYRGPIGGGAFAQTLDFRRVEAWGVRLLEPALEEVIEEWLEKGVLGTL